MGKKNKELLEMITAVENVEVQNLLQSRSVVELLMSKFPAYALMMMMVMMMTTMMMMMVIMMMMLIKLW